MDTAFLIARLIIGLAIAAHGAQKLFGWFGGHGLAGTAGFFESLGWRPGRLFVLGAGLGEFGGGLLVVLGLGGALGPALVVMVMLTAIFSVHVSKGFWATDGGYELNTMYIVGALLLAFAGFGAYSLDRVFASTFLTTPAEAWAAIGVAVILSVLNILARRPAPAAQKPA